MSHFLSKERFHRAQRVVPWRRGEPAVVWVHTNSFSIQPCRAPVLKDLEDPGYCHTEW